MDTLVPPSATNPGLVTSGNHEHSRDHSLELATIIQNSANGVRDSVNTVGHAALATAERIGIAAESTAQRMGSEGRLITNQNGAEGRAATERLGLENLNATRDEGKETRGDVDRFGFHVAEKVDSYGLKNIEATKDSLKDLLISHKDDLRDVLISQKNDFKDVLLKQCQVEKDMLLQFKDAQLIAMQNKADLAKEIAECCCENKALILETSKQTELMMLKIESDRREERYRDLKEDYLALKVRSGLPPALTPAVSL